LAYNTIFELHENYNRNNEIEKMDFVGDILDMIVGYYVGKNIRWEIK
jgi:hypothetical protein